jgi:hypothetical protein
MHADSNDGTTATSPRTACGTQATALSDQAAVPPQDGAGRDQPVRPQPSGQEAYQRGEDRTVGPVQPWPAMGAAQHGNLVPQHEQLEVLGCR